MREQICFYSVIPATVRYDKKLNPNAKLLYGEITALATKEGFCCTTNEYFSNLYGVSTRTITDWAKLLENCGYIFTEIETKRYDDGTVKKVRKIYICDYAQKRSNHIEENFAYNNKKG